jgi:hypothetical protein
MLKGSLSFLLGIMAAGAVSVRAQNPAPAPASAKPASVAYRYRLLGVYDEQSGEPLADVEIADVFNKVSARTTATGTVSLYFLPEGGALVSIRKLGYEVQMLTVSISPADTLPITITLKRATQLPTVVVKDSAPKYVPAIMRGFEERKAAGFGHFIDDSVFRKNESHLLSDLLPGRLPGLQISMGPRGTKYLASGRKQCSGPALLRSCDPTKQPSCFVAVYIDGVRVYDPGMRDNSARPDFARLSAQDYGAAEFYQGASIPPEFLSAANSDCGVLLLWTRTK